MLCEHTRRAKGSPRPAVRAEGTVEAILRELGITVSFGAYGDAFDGMLECEN